VSLILSIVAGSLIEAFTGNILKIIFINIPITNNINISVSAFLIATLLVKYQLFGGVA
jgi:hypothetical protein